VPCGINTYKSSADLECKDCAVGKVSLPGSITVSACKTVLFGGLTSCGTGASSIMAKTLCTELLEQDSITVHTATALGTTQLVRYSFADSYGCNLQADLPAAQCISGATPNQVLQCTQIPDAVYVTANAQCHFACDENHTRASDTCARVCGNVTAAHCDTGHYAADICEHAGYTLYHCEPCSYADGLQLLPWSRLSNVNAAACPTAPCAAGTQGTNSVCAPCDANTFSAAGSATCAVLPASGGQPAGSSACATCFDALGTPPAALCAVGTQAA